MRIQRAIFLGLCAGIIGALVPEPATAASPQEKRIEQLKREIVRIGRRATAELKRQNEFRPETRVALDPLVAELARLAPAKSLTQQLAYSLGAWKNIWSDLPFTTAIASQIYQVVFPGGYYYNISRYERGNEVYTSFLRGEYLLRESDLAINFTKAVKDEGFPRRGSDIYRLAMRAEQGEFDTNLDEENSRGVGQRGNLVTFYIDDEIRVIGGGTLDGSVPSSLFILERVKAIQ